MPKAKPDENDDTIEQELESEDENEGLDDSAADLKPVRPKIGESGDTLRKRSEWFQKRRGGS